MESTPALFAVQTDGEDPQPRTPHSVRNALGKSTTTENVGPVPADAAVPVRRLGLLIDGLVQESWVVDAVRATLDLPGMYLAAIAVTARGRSNSIAHRFHQVVAALDGQLRGRHEPLLSTVDVAACFPDVPCVEVTLERTSAGWVPDAAGLRVLRATAAELWLCVCEEAPRRPLPEFGRYVLGLEVGIDVAAGNPWAGAIEVASGSPVTIARVVDYQSATGSLYQGLGATIGNSARRNRLAALRRAIDFLKRSAIAVMRDGSSAARAELPPGYPVSPRPTVPRVLQLGWRLAEQIALNRWLAFARHRQWQIGYAFGDGTRPDVQRLRYLIPPRDRFWADPFAVTDGTRNFVFFEEYRYRVGRGRIVAVEVDEHGVTLGTPRPVLERPYHLSYPFLFRWRGGLYMLPESAENNTVELYRCEELPSRWRLERVLLNNVRAYDATLWQQGDRWWMFVSIAAHGTDGNDELHLYSSDITPLGPWTPHPKNPVVVDTRRARPAGPLFVLDGALYRPSQDCSGIYGHSISINRVDRLDEHDYAETPVERIDPGWRRDIICVHTLGGSDRLRVIDMLVERPLWRVATSGQG